VLARRLGLVALVAAGFAVVGCGGVNASGVKETTGTQLSVYSSLPLQGPSAAVSQQIVNGEKLALSEAGGHVGPYTISYVSMDDASPTSHQWNPGVTATNAKTAAQDASTIAYLGDYNSAATAVSLPLINAAGILQVSPASPYVGLTSSLDAGQDEPERFYPSGHRNFGRLQPGDPIQAAAQYELMQHLGVRKLYVIDDQDPFEVPLASILGSVAEKGGIEVAAHDSISVTPEGTYKGEVEKVDKSGAQAVFFAGGTGAGTVTLWHELHRADPQLLLLGVSSMASESFVSQLGASGANTYLTTPLLPNSDYPASAQRVFADYRKQFGGDPNAYALYGFEAMSVVLASIRAAGDEGNERPQVVSHFFQIAKDRDSVLGRYSIGANGETTLTQYAIDRVSEGHLKLFAKAKIVPPIASSTAEG
jgi:branched-chain amino acid transport system substrate-binding protein